MFSADCAMSIPAIPTQIYEAYVFLVPFAIHRIRRTSVIIRTIYRNVPMNPNFSARTANRQSD